MPARARTRPRRTWSSTAGVSKWRGSHTARSLILADLSIWLRCFFREGALEFWRRSRPSCRDRRAPPTRRDIHNRVDRTG